MLSKGWAVCFAQLPWPVFCSSVTTRMSLSLSVVGERLEVRWKLILRHVPVAFGRALSLRAHRNDTAECRRRCGACEVPHLARASTATASIMATFDYRLRTQHRISASRVNFYGILGLSSCGHRLVPPVDDVEPHVALVAARLCQLQAATKSAGNSGGYVYSR